MDHSKWSIKFTWVNTVDIFLIQVRINYYKKALKSIKIKKKLPNMILQRILIHVKISCGQKISDL